MPLTSVVKSSVLSYCFDLNISKAGIAFFGAHVYIRNLSSMKKRIAVPWSMQMQKDLQDLYPHHHLRYQKDECNSLIGGCGHLSEAWRDVSDSNRTVLHTRP